MGCLHSAPRGRMGGQRRARHGGRAAPDRVFLLLGAHGAGKTTALRHLELATGELEDEEARAGHAGVVREVVAAYANLLSQQVANSAYITPELVDEALCQEARRLGQMVEGGLSPAASDAFCRFAARADLLPTLERAGFRSVSPADLAALADAARRGAESDYLATDEDVLRLQWLTVGVNARDFEAEQGVVRVVDVGGRYPERAKWPAVLADADGPAAGAAVVFVAALDGFARQMAESPERNELLEALELFEQVCRQHAADRPVHVLLTKADRFRAAYVDRSRDFGRCFSGFKGATAAEAIEHVRAAFMERHGGGRKLHVLVANLTDPHVASPLLTVFNASVNERAAKTRGGGGGGGGGGGHRRMVSSA